MTEKNNPLLAESERLVKMNLPMLRTILSFHLQKHTSRYYLQFSQWISRQLQHICYCSALRFWEILFLLGKVTIKYCINITCNCWLQKSLTGGSRYLSDSDRLRWKFKVEWKQCGKHNCVHLVCFKEQNSKGFWSRNMRTHGSFFFRKKEGRRQKPSEVPALFHLLFFDSRSYWQQFLSWLPYLVFRCNIS